MKKFLLVSTALFFLILAFISGFMGKFYKFDTVETFTKVEGEKIFIYEHDRWSEFKIVGINMNPGKPGAFPKESSASKSEYLRWFSYIVDMSINCIRVEDMMNNEFYEALDEFNQERENPLYLLQGIWFDEVFLKDGYDPQSEKMKKVFKDYVKYMINLIHGDPYYNVNINIFETNLTDVSKYVLGYTVGIEWGTHNIIYSEIMNDKNPYSGRYFYTPNNASSFEAYLAEIGDYLVEYETENYGHQRLVTFIGSSSLHSKKIIPMLQDLPLKIGEYKQDIFKSFVDAENIKSTKAFKAGSFVSYNIYPSHNTFLGYEGDLERYLNEINNYHTIPVVISEYGVPSGRLATDFISNSSKAYIEEKEQAQILVDTFRAIEGAGCGGSIICEWSDSWFRSSWNTKEEKILDKSPYWNDAQTYSQFFGIMAFDTGRDESASYPDDSIQEWEKKDIINANESGSLSIKSDEKYIYFMVNMKGEFNPINEEVYIDLDITPKSGAKKSSQYGLNFDRECDFIIHVKGQENSRVLVHEYYNTHSFLQKENLKIRPDVIKVRRDMDKFSKVMISIRPKAYVEALGKFVEEQSIETGLLLHGNGNPKSSEFNSVSDFFIGKNYVEIRIPWGLLNFTDPSTKQIQDDYYDVFGINSISIKEIYIGLTVKRDDEVINRLNSKGYKWNDWFKPIYHERLKESYYILKEELSKEIN